MKRVLSMAFVSVVFLMTLVSSFGIVAPYWKEYPLEMMPGQTVVINLTLQNMVGEQDMSFRAAITDDKYGIASLVDENPVYLVPLGRADIIVPIEIRVPSDTAVGEVLEDVTVRFSQVSSSSEGGTVEVASAFNVAFPVKIISPAGETIREDQTSGVNMVVLITIILGILILGIVLYLILSKRGEDRPVFQRPFSNVSGSSL
jgi:hypothetical protein